MKIVDNLKDQILAGLTEGALQALENKPKAWRQRLYVKIETAIALREAKREQSDETTR